MKHVKLFAILISAWAGFAGPANAQFEVLTTLYDNQANTALGGEALSNVVDGSGCSPCGYGDTASGWLALGTNSLGRYDTSAGAWSLFSNTNGSWNTASGYTALYSNTTGEGNTASGMGALYSEINGTENTADGYYAQYNNVSGSYNTASGSGALYGTPGASGSANTGIGATALHSFSSGSNNTAVGASALYNNATGANNIALGSEAGFNILDSNNIDIGHEGVASDSGVIRIGTKGTQSETYVAGIDGVTVTGGVEVFINSAGQLGTKKSSLRYKDDIQSIGAASERLYQLRPVSFRYKQPEPNGERPLQYGLIAEEVAAVYPELAIRDENGRVDGVHYDELAPMLLNEMQKQQSRIAAQDATIQIQEQELAGVDQLKRQVAELKRQSESIQAAMTELLANKQRVAMR